MHHHVLRVLSQWACCPRLPSGLGGCQKPSSVTFCKARLKASGLRTPGFSLRFQVLRAPKCPARGPHSNVQLHYSELPSLHGFLDLTAHGTLLPPQSISTLCCLRWFLVGGSISETGSQQTVQASLRGTAQSPCPSSARGEPAKRKHSKRVLQTLSWEMRQGVPNCGVESGGIRIYKQSLLASTALYVWGGGLKIITTLCTLSEILKLPFFPFAKPRQKQSPSL
jgi:hypothetical protein